jgi:hypothetical protein
MGVSKPRSMPRKDPVSASFGGIAPLRVPLECVLNANGEEASTGARPERWQKVKSDPTQFLVRDRHVTALRQGRVLLSLSQKMKYDPTWFSAGAVASPFRRLRPAAHHGG